MCKWHCQYEVENNECEYLTDCEWLISEVMMMLRGWVEFRSLMAWGKKLLLSLSVFAIMLRKLLPDESRVNKQLPGLFETLVILASLPNLYIFYLWNSSCCVLWMLIKMLSGCRVTFVTIIIIVMNTVAVSNHFIYLSIFPCSIHVNAAQHAFQEFCIRNKSI